MGVMFLKIKNSFDSHCHFLATGQVACSLSLKNLKSANDIQNLVIKDHHFQGEWLTGFGWDQNQWINSEFPTKEILDSAFPTTPVFFSRVDGHASWINTRAIQKLTSLGFDFSQDIRGGKISRDLNGHPTGILFDQAHIQALMKLPSFDGLQTKHFIQTAQSIFNKGGFTHVRDLSMTEPLWKQLTEMSERKELTVHIDGFVTIESLNDLENVFSCIEVMKKNPCNLLKVRGVKLFFDGSLGSHTALLSKPYLGSTELGICSWSLSDVKNIMRATWQKNLEFAVHTIGDEAVHQIVQVARTVSTEGVLGRLNLEHVQLLRPETLQMMKSLHITCHLQPCHWISDHLWLRNVIPQELVAISFPWESLRKNKITIRFGSDSPIEPTSLLLTQQALIESQKLGWSQFQDEWYKYHQHPESNWVNCWTEIADDKIKQVYFNGESLL